AAGGLLIQPIKDAVLRRGDDDEWWQTLAEGYLEMGTLGLLGWGAEQAYYSAKFRDESVLKAPALDALWGFTQDVYWAALKTAQGNWVEGGESAYRSLVRRVSLFRAIDAHTEGPYWQSRHGKDEPAREAARAYKNLYQEKAKAASRGRRLSKQKEAELRQEARVVVANLGVDRKAAESRGRAQVRRQWMDKFWDAAENDDEAEAQRLAKILSAIGVNARGFEQSAGYRKDRLGEEAIRLARRAFARRFRE
ncbi:hypothetical protein LCGC14_2650580, partial [marine sediment metagenome]